MRQLRNSEILKVCKFCSEKKRRLSSASALMTRPAQHARHLPHALALAQHLVPYHVHLFHSQHPRGGSLLQRRMDQFLSVVSSRGEPSLHIGVNASKLRDALGQASSEVRTLRRRSP